MKRWFDKHKDGVITIGMVIVITLIGYYIFNTMATTLTEHPEITEIGPPGVTNIGPVALITVFSVLAIEIIIWLSKRGKELC